MQLVTKLRPYIRTFLMEASRMFELSIYTLGNRLREYALQMARLLDPGNLFFGGRIIPCNDSIEENKKGWDLVNRDVRLISRLLQQQVLKECKIVFGHVFPLNVKASTHELWKMAVQMGATCSTEVDASATHVVAANAGTHKSKGAVEQGKFLVNPQWIHTANFMLQKQPEHNFPCS